MPTTPPHARFSFAFKLAIAAALVLAGDLIFYQYDLWGGAFGVFALAWLTGTVLASRAIRKRPGAWIALLLAAIAAGALVYDPSLLAWALFWIALSMAALLPGTGVFDDGWRWFQRLFGHGLRSLIAPLMDMLKFRRAGRGRDWTPGLAAVLRTLALPLMGSAVILLLFAAANPVIVEALEALSFPILSGAAVGRLILWAMLFTLVWGTLRPRRTRPLFATFDGSGDIDLPGVNPRSVLLSLILFNALFAVQNGLDIAYLWGGLPLPEGMTLAEYAHRGAYPLIATALLAGLFVIVTLRPGSQTAAHPQIRALLVLWIAQNVFLVGSTILRTLDYVDAYSLTRLRVAALAWMVLVAVGLVLICWRMLRAKSASWLINTNLAAAGATLLAFCFVDTGAIAAAWNVRHAREVGGRGTALDLCYLNGLGSSALVSLVELEQRPLPPAFAERVRHVRQQAMAHTVWQQGSGGWNLRDAQRLAWAQRRIAASADKPVSGQRDCAGRLVPLPEPVPQAGTPAPLTAEPQR